MVFLDLIGKDCFMVWFLCLSLLLTGLCVNGFDYKVYFLGFFCRCDQSSDSARVYSPESQSHDNTRRKSLGHVFHH